MSIAFTFPGQGSQAVGMGKYLAEAFPEARAVFDEVDEALGEPLSTLIFEGAPERLTLTANAQPALMATSLAAVRAVEERVGRKLADTASQRKLLDVSLLNGLGWKASIPLHEGLKRAYADFLLQQAHEPEAVATA